MINDKLFKLLAKIFSRFYFTRKDYSEQIYQFLRRIGWTGIAREGLAQLCFLFAVKKCVVMPRLVRFEVSNFCNLKCPMCPQPKKMKRAKKNMEFEFYRKMIDFNSYIKEVELFNWGEPLMNPNIVKFVQYASDRKMLTRFVTNGTLLNSNITRQLIEAGLDEIYFSLDNIYDGYEKIRKHSFEKVLENISEFIETARKSKRKIKIGINIVRSQYNATGIDQAIQLFEKMDIDILSVDECQFETQIEDRASRCFEPYRNMTVLSNGDVVPCCVDYDGVLSLGSAWKEPDLRQIFNNEAYKQLRGSFRSRIDMHKICRLCNYRSVTIDV